MARRRKSDSADLIMPIAAFFVLFVFYLSFKTGIAPLKIIIGIIVLGIAGIIIWIRLINRSIAKVPAPSFQMDSLPNEIFTPTQTTSEKLRSIDWFQFEKLVALIYSQRGYQVERIGGAKPDGGVDLKIEKDGQQIVVQCKHWKKWQVRIRDIREFLGTLTDSKIQKGIFVTLQGYTADARDFAAKHGIEVIDETALLQMMRDTNGQIAPEISTLLNDTRKVCPKCESDLVLRTATRGSNVGNQFWGCSTYPRCTFKMTL